jgi:FkbM family methyltransferase
MQLDPVESVQMELLKHGVIEPPTIALYQKILQPGDNYVDAGAHVGFHTMIARSLTGAYSRIIAIDPQPYNCALILTNSELNSFENIEVVVSVLGAEAGFVTLRNQPSNDKAKLSMNPEWLHSECAQKFSVPMRTLDDVSKGLNSVKLLKIDVESYEMEVLKGARTLLSKSENVVIELHPESLHVVEVAELLKEAGFDLYDVAGTDWAPGQPAADHNVWARRH